MGLDNNALNSIARITLATSKGEPVISDCKSVITMDITCEKVFDQVTFTWSKRFDIAGLATADIIIDPIAIPSDHMLIVLKIAFVAMGAGPIFVDITKEANCLADGTLWTGFNRDYRSTITPNTVIRYNPTIVSAGTPLPSEFMIPSLGGGPAAKGSFGGESEDNILVIGKTTEKYLLRLINQENLVANCVFSMLIFEIPEV